MAQGHSRLRSGLPVFIVLLFATALGFAAEATPLPANIIMTPPDSSIPADVQVFYGRWEGMWAEVPRAATLIVKQIQKEGTRYRADVIHSWGPTPLAKSGYLETKAWIADGVLTMEFARQVTTITFRVTSDQALEATFVQEQSAKSRSSYLVHGTLRKVE